MPKIVRNEIEYSSTTSTANQISYLNTTSGLSATNVQSAIDEVVTDIPANASVLPISANDPTDTKSYIDTATTVNDVSSAISRNTTNVSSTDFLVNCYTVGKMAYLIITNFQSATAWSSDREIATGLPKPKTDFNFVGSLYNSNGGSSVRLRVRSNGDLYSWYNNISSGSNIFGCIAYPIA